MVDNFGQCEKNDRRECCEKLTNANYFFTSVIINLISDSNNHFCVVLFGWPRCRTDILTDPKERKKEELAAHPKKVRCATLRCGAPNRGGLTLSIPPDHPE